MGEFFEFKNIEKYYGDVHVVKNVSFGVRCGEVFSLLGPSGCGKTTMLRIAGGFEDPESGEVFLDSVNITDLAPNKRKINTVFQNYALFPHMSIWDNIAFGPRTAGMPEDQVAKKVERMLEIIRLEGHGSRMPNTISGGQKQRVAIARALINSPKLLLLDEPLAALDLKLRQYMLLELDRIHDEVGTTFIYVTHDQGEAMSLSDRIAVMNGGVIEQIGTPAEIYENPRTKFVASFIGDTNFFDGKIVGQIFDTYIICERGDLVYLIDQHAAHERILYDRIIENFTVEHKQSLLIPFKLNMTGEECEYFERILPNLENLGFEIGKSGSAYLINAVPEPVAQVNFSKFFSDLFANMQSENELTLENLLKDKLCQQACKAAIKGGQSLSRAQIERVIKYYVDENGNLPTKCPHGRPAVVAFTAKDVEKLFKRIV